MTGIQFSNFKSYWLIFFLNDIFLEIYDDTFPLQKITMKTKKLEKILLGLQQGSGNHQGRSSIYMKSFFLKKIQKDQKFINSTRIYLEKLKKKGFKSFTIKTKSRKVKIGLKLQGKL